MLWCFRLGFCFNPNNRGGSILDSFACLWDLFPPASLCCPAWYEHICLVLLHLVTLSWYHWEACLLLKGSRGAVDLGERDCEEGLWRGEGGREGGREGCSWDALEKRINKIKFKMWLMYTESGLFEYHQWRKQSLEQDSWDSENVTQSKWGI